MKILHLSGPKSWRGGEQQLAYLIEALDQEEHIEQMIFGRRNSAMEHYCRNRNHPFVPFSSSIGWNPISAMRLGSLCKEFQPDLLHLHDSRVHSIAVLAAKMNQITAPMVLHRRVDFPLKTNSLTQLKYNHPQIKRIICVSEAIAQMVREGVEYSHRVQVIHSGVDLDRFPFPIPGKLRKSYRISPDTMLIGNIAALTPQKDYPTFLRTVQRVHSHLNAHFFIIGAGKLKKELQTMVHKLQLNEVVSFTGFRSDIADILPELNLLLFPSQTEGLGTTILDAMAAGVPVVATEVGGIPEIITHDTDGLLAEVGDDETLAHYVLRLANEPDLYERLVEAAKLRVAYFSKEQMALRIQEVYEELLREEGAEEA